VAAALLVFFLLRENPTWQEAGRVSSPRIKLDEKAAANRPAAPMGLASQTGVNVNNIISKSSEVPPVQMAARKKQESANAFPEESLSDKTTNSRPMADISASGGAKSLQKNLEESPAAPPEQQAKDAGVVGTLPAQAPQAEARAESKKAKRMAKEEGSGFAPAPSSQPDAESALFYASGASADRLVKTASLENLPLQSWTGDNSPQASELQKLLSTEEDFKNYWQVLKSGQPEPSVDFTKQSVVLLAAGQEPTSGYSIHILRTENNESGIVLHYRVVSPPAGAVTAQVITYPWLMQVIGKPSQALTFQKDP
jgi:hypothetical protein